MMPLARGQLRIILGVAPAGFNPYPVVAGIEPEFHPVTGTRAAPADNFTIATYGPFLLDPHCNAKRRCISPVADNTFVAIDVEIGSGAVKIQSLTGVAGRKTGAVHEGAVATVAGRIEPIAVKLPPALKTRFGDCGCAAQHHNKRDDKNQFLTHNRPPSKRLRSCIFTQIRTLSSGFFSTGSRPFSL